MVEKAEIRNWLAAWAAFAERHWTTDPDNPASGWFGTGYNNWGVQTNQKYAAAMATLAVTDDGGVDRDWAGARALAAVRFSLHSHVSGEAACTDGTQWGHTWISALGIERMMYGVELLRPQLGADELAGLERVLVSEADWLLSEHQRGGHHGVFGDPWASSGKNAPESNIWNGALLWRTAALYPDHPHAGAWRERACEFFVNGVSVPGDADDDRVMDGEPIRERFRGANFFDSYALDHHGYLNVGYMVICASNAAILHFDLARAGLTAPESLHHHQDELWRVIRPMIFADGRLARIGGDSRVRYTYCQEYLLPTLLYAADRLGDAQAEGLLAAQLRLIDAERQANDDGSFYGARLSRLARASAYYYTRLESDRACTLGMVDAYLDKTRFPPPATESYEDSVAGGWCAPDHGAALHRSRRRLASFSWRAYGLTQGMCQPPDASDLAEWQLNLAPEVRVLGDPWTDGKPSRRLLYQQTQAYDGGFVTTGAVGEGADLRIAEGWTGGPAATSYIAVAALPDDRTMVGLHLCRAADWWIYLQSVKGLHLNIPNDLYNGGTRRITTGSGDHVVTSPPDADSTVRLDSRWATIDGRVGVIGLYGASTLTLDRSATPRGGRYESLLVDELCFGQLDDPGQLAPRTTFLDIGWAVLSEASGEETASFAAQHTNPRLDSGHPTVRALAVTGADQVAYVLVANVSADVVDWSLPEAMRRDGTGADLVTGAPIGDVVRLSPNGGTLLRLDA